jgi:hypothetical protein
LKKRPIEAGFAVFAIYNRYVMNSRRRIAHRSISKPAREYCLVGGRVRIGGFTPQRRKKH